MFVNQKGSLERQICSVYSSWVVNPCIVTAKLYVDLKYGRLFVKRGRGTITMERHPKYKVMTEDLEGKLMARDN